MVPEVQSEIKFEFRQWGSDGVLSHLGPGEVHVWSALLDPASTDIGRFSEILSPDEKERASRFHFEKNRNEFIISRGSLRVLLGSYLGVPAHELGFAYSRYGKPCLAGSDEISPMEFNLSHSEGIVVLAFTKGRKVGVDERQPHFDDSQRLRHRQTEATVELLCGLRGQGRGRGQGQAQAR